VHAPHEQGPWAPGAANQTWLHHSLESLQQDIAHLGGDLLLHNGDCLAELER